MGKAVLGASISLMHGTSRIQVRIARSPTFGPEGTWEGAREKAPAAICRKVAEAFRVVRLRYGVTASRPDLSSYRRLFEGVRRLMDSDSSGPVYRLGGDDYHQLARQTCYGDCWQATPNSPTHLTIGVRGRNSTID